MSAKWKEALIPARGGHETRPVPIVSDAAVATEPVADGRLIPLLIVDTAERPDIEQLVKAHEHITPGDVDTQWGRALGKGELESVFLFCDFKRPVRCFLMLEFELPRLAAVVDLIVGARAVYLQPGQTGDRLVTAFDNPRIIAEVFVDDFAPEWDRIYSKVVEREFRKRGGLRRSQARRAAKDHITQMRHLRGVRKARLPDQE